MTKSLESMVKYARDILHIRNWSERELAKRADLTPASVNSALKGNKDIRLSTIEALAMGLEVEPFYLLMSPEQRASWDQKTEAKSLESRISSLEAALKK